MVQSATWIEPVLAVGLLMVAGVLMLLATGPVLRSLPEPREGDTDDKIPYRALATRRFALAVTGCALAALAIVVIRLPPPGWPLWLPLGTLGILLIGIDAATTWLPLRLTHALWLATAAMALVGIAVTADPVAVAGRVALGAVLVGGFFWLFWRVIGGLGFGDVRLAPVLGAVTASVSWQVLAAALLIGTLLGALHGVALRLRGRAGPFPYGPALVAGAFVALAVAG